MFKTLQKLYNKSPKIYFGLFILALAFNCSGTDEEKGAALVKDSIKAHGSMIAFNELKSVTFNKTTRLFEADGSIESEITQKQSFQLQPEFLTEIEWEKDSQSHKIFYDGVKAIKTINGEVITDSVEVLKSENAAKAASYVFFQPFKLQTDNTVLVYEGDTELDDSTSVSKIKVRYKDTNSTDKWTYYFDEDDVLVANSIKNIFELNIFIET